MSVLTRCKECALSCFFAGLKRHAVTLFEGGRVAGEGVTLEMVNELWSSFAEGQMFEGDMLRLTQVCLFARVRIVTGRCRNCEL